MKYCSQRDVCPSNVQNAQVLNWKNETNYQLEKYGKH